MGTVIPYLLALIQDLYNLMGWPGVLFLMALESACIPIPSEIIMPLSGWMLVKAQNLPLVHNIEAGFYGALGCTIGSALAYWVGAVGGRPLVEKYGRYLLISHHDLELADRWFSKYGNAAIFFSRLLPVVRTFISLPAGIARMRFTWFLPLTFAGSFPWCLGLSYGGYLAGEHWDKIYELIRPFSDAIIIIVILGVGYFIYRHLKRYRKNGR